MNFRAASVLIGALLFALPLQAEEQKENFVIWQGIFQKNKEGDLTKVLETDQIPYITGEEDPSVSYGFIVNTTDGSDFPCQVKLHFTTPTQFRSSDGTVKSGLDFELEPESSSDGMICQSFTIDEGDPPGICKMEIFVNDRLLTTLSFDIQPRKP